jgi:CheY-like chemotaxis protein
MAFECADHLLKANRRRVSCVIADVQMPGMTGLELYNRLVASGDPIPAILNHDPEAVRDQRFPGDGDMSRVPYRERQTVITMTPRKP